MQITLAHPTPALPLALSITEKPATTKPSSSKQPQSAPRPQPQLSVLALHIPRELCEFLVARITASRAREQRSAGSSRSWIAGSPSDP